MKTIDFLPQKHRERDARRRAGAWRLLAAVVLAVAIGATSLAQWLQCQGVRRQLDELQPQFADAQAKQSMLAQLQTELTRETAAATLYAYLQTTWPRTQVVAAVALPVREGLRIEQLHVADLNQATSQASETTSTEPTGMSPATRDLTAIRSEGAARVTQAEITGICQHASVVHEYLSQIEQSQLIERAELLSLENVSVAGQARELRFTARLKLRAAPGWHSSVPAPASPAAVTLTQSSL